MFIVHFPPMLFIKLLLIFILIFYAEASQNCDILNVYRENDLNLRESQITCVPQEHNLV